MGEEVECWAGRGGHECLSAVAHRSVCCSREISGYELSSADLIKRVPGPHDCDTMYLFSEEPQRSKHRWDQRDASMRRFKSAYLHYAYLRDIGFPCSYQCISPLFIATIYRPQMTAGQSSVACTLAFLILQLPIHSLPLLLHLKYLSVEMPASYIHCWTPVGKGSYKITVVCLCVCMSVCLDVTKINFVNFLKIGSYDFFLNLAQ